MPAISWPTAVLNQIASSLVAQERYQTVEEALWEIALSTVKDKVAHYRRRTRKLEKKYDMGFEQFTDHLKNRASPAEEDDWLSWRAAQGMLTDWEESYRELRHAAPH